MNAKQQKSIGIWLGWSILVGVCSALAADPTSLPGMTGVSPGPTAGNPPKGKQLCKDQYDQYKAQLAQHPDDAKTWDEFRACTSELKRWSDGAEVGRAALQKGVQLPGPHMVLGLAYLHSKEYQKAADAFDEAIRLKHEQPLAYYYLGMSYLFLRQPEQAAQAAQTAVDLDPTTASHYSQLAYAELLLDHQDKAEAAAKKAVALDPNNVAAFKVLGNLYAQQGKKEESDKAFEQAIHANGRVAATSPFVADKTVASPRAVPAPAAPAPESAGSNVPVGDPEDLCRDQWNKMKAAMSRGDTAEGLTYISAYLDTRQQYRQAFARMGPQRAREIFENLGDLEDCKTVLLTVNCKTTATTSRNGEIRSVEENVRCERNEDKIWRIRSF